MATGSHRLQRYLDYIVKKYKDSDRNTSVPKGTREPDVEARWGVVAVDNGSQREINDPGTADQFERYQHSVENYVGTVKVPVGIAGPLRVNGVFASGTYYIPLATTEAALVASFSRGAQIISDAGGCSTVLVDEGVSRAPGFAFETVSDATAFVVWIMSHIIELKRHAEQTTRHGKLIDIKSDIEGNHVYLIFDFVTTDASGQNMATIASEAMCGYISENSPIKPRYLFCETNLSGDKKATTQSFQSVRGRRVTAEVMITKDLVRDRLRTTPQDMARYWNFGAVGSAMSGAIGTQGHYANGLAALYLACGQDVACVAESAVGITRMETTDNGDLYACVTLPSLMVATVGGGTGLPSQSACLDILKLNGPGNAHAFAEVAAGLCLAGELSIVAAICAHEFTKAHKRLARNRKRNGGNSEN
jgi:hydroxymethylglutaryl-CoA reductase (NADPH)